jgi:BlaI family penicillinase repressor
VTRRNTLTQPVTDLQRAILDLLWAAGPATADEVRAGLLPKHQLKDSSVRTLLRRLEARGLVTHEVGGKAFIYKARVRPHRMAARAVRQIIERFCGGSVEQFLTGMVDEKVLTLEEIEQLARKVRRS